MIEKILSKGFYLISNIYYEEPYLTVISILVFFILLVCFAKLFKYIVLSFFILMVVIIGLICGFSYYKTTTLEYQLAQQMISENCVDTIQMEKYLHYENITFVDGVQYPYNKQPKDSIARNYVCHKSKRTYSVDFLLDVYLNKKSFKEDFDSLKEDAIEIGKAMNNKV